MTPIEGLDFAWQKPSPAQVKAAGGHWVAGYFSTDTTKNLNRSNIPPFLAAGIPVVTVWETTTGRATQGRQAGVDDARAAEAERVAAGLPSTHVHYFAVDEDTSWASVQAYFDGVISVLGLARVGCYGGYPVVVGAHGHGIRFLWQTVAWSGGRWASYACIRQTGGTLLGGSADIDYAEVPDFGQTPRPVTTPVEDAVTPAEIEAVAAAVVAKMETGSTGGRFDRDVLEGTPMYWLLRVLDTSLPLPSGANLPAVVGEVQAARVALAARDKRLVADVVAAVKAAVVVPPAK